MRVRVRVYPEQARAEVRNIVIARPRDLALPHARLFPRVNSFRTLSSPVEREREIE